MNVAAQWHLPVAKRKNKYYEYYTSSKAVKEGHCLCRTGSVPAGELDRFVLDKVRNAFKSPEIIQELVHQIKPYKPEYDVREIFDIVQSVEDKFHSIAFNLKCQQTLAFVA